MSPHIVRVLAVPLLALGGATGAVQAQCAPVWQPGLGWPGVNGRVLACKLWDPAGPAPQVAVVGGEFTIAGSTPAPGLAFCPGGGAPWFAAPLGVVDRVTALAIESNGDLLVAGSRQVGGSPVHVVARWNGTTLTQLGSAFDARIAAIASLWTGEVVAGGAFTVASGTPAAGLARWNGTAWSQLGGVQGGAAPAVAALDGGTGELFVGGSFQSVGGTAASNVARWNGVTWQALGAGVASEVTCVAAISGAEVVVAGPALGDPQRWTPQGWSPMPGLLPPTAGTFAITHLTVAPAAFRGPSVVAAGRFRCNGAEGIAAWDPLSGWFAFANGPTGAAPPEHVCVDGVVFGPFLIAGDFDTYGFADVAGVVRSATGVVEVLGEGLGRPLYAVGSFAGDAVIGGAFRNIGNDPVAAIARDDGATWTALGLGLGQGVWWNQLAVFAIATAADGSLVIGGSFTQASGPAATVSAYNVARWNGTAWSTFGTGAPMLGAVRAVLPRANGDVTIGGDGGIARWSGNAWTQLTGVAAGLTGMTLALTELPNGDLVAGGDLQPIGSSARPGVLRWNGTTWGPLGGGLGSVLPGTTFVVRAAVRRRDGVMFVVGSVGLAGAPFVAAWDGTAWQSLPAPASGPLFAATLLPDGDLVVGGTFASIGGVPCSSVARWDGQAWIPFGTGVQRLDGSPGTVSALAWSPPGELLVGGEFAHAGTELAVNFARLQGSCPALAVPFAFGCSIAGGAAATLTPDTLPWLGDVYRATAAPVPTPGLAVDVLGLGTLLVPIVSLLPQGAPGCTLWTTPDLLTVALPVAGRVTRDLPIPLVPALVGQTLHHQVVPFAFDASGAIAAIGATNRLTLTIGSF